MAETVRRRGVGPMQPFAETVVEAPQMKVLNKTYRREIYHMATSPARFVEKRSASTARVEKIIIMRKQQR